MVRCFRADWRALTLSLLATTAPACKSCRDGDNPRAGKPIARITELHGDVDHRAAQSLTWRSASAGLQLHHRDMVKTGPASKAEIRYDSGGSLSLDERSLVVLEAPQRQQQRTRLQIARVQSGTVRGVAAPGKTMRVVTPDGKTTEIRAKGGAKAKLRLRLRPDGELEVAVLEGRAHVSRDGRAVELESGQLVAASKGAGLRQPRRLLAYPALRDPAVDAKLPANEPVVLRWREIAGAHHYRVQLGRAISFFGAKSLLSPPGKTELAAPQLEQGQRYVWRVASVDSAGHEGEFGFARRFSIVAPRWRDAGVDSGPDSGEPLRTRPADNAQLEYVRRPKRVVFRWSRGDGKKFRFVLGPKRKLDGKLIVDRVVAKPRTSVKKLRAGTYYWRVFRISPHGDQQPLGRKPLQLTVVRRRPPRVDVPPAIQWK